MSSKTVRLWSRDQAIGYCHPAQARRLVREGAAEWIDGNLTLTGEGSLDALGLPSTHGIGDPVYVTLQGHQLEGVVRTVLFTSSKVRYSVVVPIDLDHVAETATTLHNLDSILVTSRDGKRIEWGPDNYS